MAITVVAFKLPDPFWFEHMHHDTVSSAGGAAEGMQNDFVDVVGKFLLFNIDWRQCLMNNIYLQLATTLCVFVYIHIYIYICACIYVYMCMYIYM